MRRFVTSSVIAVFVLVGGFLPEPQTAVADGLPPDDICDSRVADLTLSKTTLFKGDTLTVTAHCFDSFFCRNMVIGVPGAESATDADGNDLPLISVSYIDHCFDFNPHYRVDTSQMRWVRIVSGTGDRTVIFKLNDTFTGQHTNEVDSRGVLQYDGPFVVLTRPEFQMWDVTKPIEVIGGDVKVEITSETKVEDEVLPGETIKYTIEANARGDTDRLILDVTAPRGTDLVAGSADMGGVETGNSVQWVFTDEDTAKVTFEALVHDENTLPRSMREIVCTAEAEVVYSGGRGNDQDDDELKVATVTLDVADGAARELGGLLLPDAGNADDLPRFDWTRTRSVEGIAADGVALLLLRARTRVRDHGKFKLIVEETEHGAEPGSLWRADDESIIDRSADGGARDSMPAGATELELTPVRNPRNRREKIPFALYRAPRDFDAGGGTAGLQKRAVKLKFELYDEDDAEVLETREEDLDIVRPLVILQHGTFDTPNGWSTFPVWAEGGNELRGFEGFSADYPFQVSRSDFSRHLGAAGPLVESAPFAWRSLLTAIEDWRRTTEYAGAQVDVVCHSYGGVNMRWAAQTQADPDPVSVTSVVNYRNRHNWGHGAFHKLITIASTHRGSAVSNQLAYMNEFGAAPGAIRVVAQRQASWIDRGGVEDQMVVSPRLKQLQRTRVPGHAVAGAGLAHFNSSYQQRLVSLFAADVPGGPFRQFGSIINTGGMVDIGVLQSLANYGFNLVGTGPRDDTTQDPNFDLTVSSYSSKANMSRSAISDYRDIEDTSNLGRDSLLGPLTHGDQIAAGSGNTFTMRATAKRIAFLLRQATDSSFFGEFPALLDTPVSQLETEFSNQSTFPPASLYRIAPGVPAKPAVAAKATVPVLTLEPDVTTVAPGDELTATVSWPDVGVAGGFLVYPGSVAGLGTVEILSADDTEFTVTVPNRRPGPFEVSAIVIAPDGEWQEALRTLTLDDGETYTELRANPPAMKLLSSEPGTFWVLGKLESGEWRELNESPKLALTSSDPAVVDFDDSGNLQPGEFGAATVTATFDGGVSTTFDVTVAGSSVPVAVRPKKKGKLKGRKKKPADFVFLSTTGFDPADLNLDTVRVNGLTPIKTKMKKDYNKDGVKDLAAFVRPRDMGLEKGRAVISIFAELADGTRVGGTAPATVK